MPLIQPFEKPDRRKMMAVAHETRAKAKRHGRVVSKSAAMKDAWAWYREQMDRYRSFPAYWMTDAEVAERDRLRDAARYSPITAQGNREAQEYHRRADRIVADAKARSAQSLPIAAE